MPNKVLKKKKLKMISAATKTDHVCKTANKRTGSCILQLFTEVPSQNLKYKTKQGFIFPLIYVDIPSSLMLSL